MSCLHKFLLMILVFLVVPSASAMALGGNPFSKLPQTICDSVAREFDAKKETFSALIADSENKKNAFLATPRGTIQSDEAYRQYERSYNNLVTYHSTQLKPAQRKYNDLCSKTGLKTYDGKTYLYPAKIYKGTGSSFSDE